MCMKGVRFIPNWHVCAAAIWGYSRQCGREQRIEIPFNDTAINAYVRPDCSAVSCALGLRCDERRIAAAEQFAKAIKLERSDSKKGLREMLAEFDKVAEMVDA